MFQEKVAKSIAEPKGSIQSYDSWGAKNEQSVDVAGAVPIQAI